MHALDESDDWSSAGDLSGGASRQNACPMMRHLLSVEHVLSSQGFGAQAGVLRCARWILAPFVALRVALGVTLEVSHACDRHGEGSVSLGRGFEGFADRILHFVLVDAVCRNGRRSEGFQPTNSKPYPRRTGSSSTHAGEPFRAID